MVGVQMQLVQLVATEVFEASLDVAMDADPDLMKVPLSGAQPSIREDTWPEVSFSYGSFCLGNTPVRPPCY